MKKNNSINQIFALFLIVNSVINAQSVQEHSRQIQPNSLYFYSIDRCQYFARAVPRQYGNYGHTTYVDPKDRITAYCKPVYRKDGTDIYK